MNLLDLVQRVSIPAPWSEGEKIPWNEPAFSQRMLVEHLSQAHDAASRRSQIIDQQVSWIHQVVLGGQPASILDLGCGPGFYASRLARLGHTCQGIDFSPASIDYARQQAAQDGLDCQYRLEDIRRADFGSGFGLVMLVFGEFNVFQPEDARLILRKARQALAPGGRLLLEVSHFEAVESRGRQARNWYTRSGGLLAAGPFLCLFESFWNEIEAVATERYYVIDPAGAAVTEMVSCTQAYTLEQYRSNLTGCGFQAVNFFPSLRGEEDPSQAEYLVLIATREKNE